MTGHNPTDRSKLGTKVHILTDKEGIPLSTVITSANTHDVTTAIETVDSIVIKRPSSKSTTKYRTEITTTRIRIRRKIRIYVLIKHTIPKI